MTQRRTLLRALPGLAGVMALAAGLRPAAAAERQVEDLGLSLNLPEAWIPIPRAEVLEAVARAREAGAPVIWVQHDDAQLVAGSADWQWVPDLQPLPGEPVVAKHFESSFEGTTLESELAARGISRIVLAGAMSNWCIRATAYAALDRGYDLTLVRDAHTTADVALDDGQAIEARQIVQDLNIVMRWISYPGRSSSTAAAAELSFASA